jgi:hypothetical protein
MEVWLSKIRRDVGENFTITESTKVCSDHFQADDFRPLLHSTRRYLKPSAFPTVFQWTSPQKQKLALQRSERAKVRSVKKAQQILPGKHKRKPAHETLEPTDENFQSTDENFQPTDMSESYYCAPETTVVDDLQSEIGLLKHKNDALMLQIEQYKAAEKEKETEMDELRRKLQELEKMNS